MLSDDEKVGAEAYFALLEAGNLLFAAVDQQLRRDGEISHAQFEILTKLRAHPDGLRMSDLANVLVVSRSGLTYQVTQLEKRGLLQRGSAPGDDRVVVVRVTPAAEGLIDHLEPGHVQLVRQAFSAVTDRRDFETLARILGQLSQTLRATRRHDDG
ncbi:MAG TPA: MarR family transcriptional regulator [Caulobacteraceae bacterium]